jgi:hypothetical protein
MSGRPANVKYGADPQTGYVRQILEVCICPAEHQSGWTNFSTGMHGRGNGHREYSNHLPDLHFIPGFWVLHPTSQLALNGRKIAGDQTGVHGKSKIGLDWIFYSSVGKAMLIR